MKRFSFCGFCTKALACFSVAVLALITFLNLLYTARVSYDLDEIVSFSFYLLPGFVMLLIAVAIPYLSSLCRKFIYRIDEGLLFGILCGVYFIMAVYLIVFSDLGIRSDSASIYQTAIEFSNGNYSALASDGYIGRYPHQAGLVLYDSIMMLSSPSTGVLFIFNLAFALGINYFTIEISETLFKSKGITLLTTAVVFAFLPQFFFIMFAYGLIPGFFFMTLAFYNTIKFASERRISNGIGAIVGASIAVLFKQNFLIGAISIVIFLLLRLLADKKERIKTAIVIVCFIAFLSVPSTLIESYYEAKSGIELDQGTPPVLWVVMGTDLDNTERAPGWYSGYNYFIYSVSGYDRELSSEIGRAHLGENLEKMKNDPSRTFHFFLDKIKSQWCEPMFQSVWSGPLEECEQYSDSALLRSIYSGGIAEQIIATLMKLLVLIIFIFSLVFLVFGEKKACGWELAFLFLIGGFLFHIAWEGKSQYIYPYVFTLIPCAVSGINSARKRLELLLRRFKNGK